MDSNKENSINNKNTDGIIDIVNKELEKRKVIKEQTKIIKDKIDNNKQEYIQIIEDEYQYRFKKIDENISKISNAVNSNNVEELQNAFKKILNDTND